MRGSWIAGAVLIACSSLAQSPNVAPSSKATPTAKTKSHNEEKREHYPTDDAPLPIRMIQSPSEEAAASDQRAKTDRQEQESLEAAKSQADTAKWQLGLSVIGGLLLLCTLYETRRTARASLIAADAAKTSADSATNSVSIMRETATNQFRAYVFGNALAGGIEAEGGEGSRVIGYLFKTTIRNMGITQATHLRCRIEKFIASADRDMPPIFAMAPLDIDPTFVLGPQLTMESQTIMIPIKELERAYIGEAKLFIWTRVEYRDIIQPQVIHHHQMCFRVFVTQSPTYAPPAGDSAYIRIEGVGTQNTAA